MLGKPGSGGARPSRPIRRKTQESTEELIRQHGRVPANKKCADCTTKVPQCVNTTVGTYICLTCSGIHRELNMRVKGIAASSFTMEEVERMQSTDNDKVNALYLARFNPSVDRMTPPVDNQDEQYLRQWLRRKYQEKAWYLPESQQPTIVAIPPTAPPADLLGFGSAPAPAAIASGWDAFAGSSQQTNAAAFPADFGSTNNDNSFPADFGSTQTNGIANGSGPTQQEQKNIAHNFPLPQQQKQFGDFSQQQQQQQSAPPQQPSPNFALQQQQQFGNFGPQPQGGPPQQHQHGNIGGQPQGDPTQQQQFGNFGDQSQVANAQAAAQQQQQQFGNFGGQSHTNPQQHFGNFAGQFQGTTTQVPSPQQQNFGSFEGQTLAHSHQAPSPQQQQQNFGNFGGQTLAAPQQAPPQQQFGNFGPPLTPTQAPPQQTFDGKQSQAGMEPQQTELGSSKPGMQLMRSPMPVEPAVPGFMAGQIGRASAIDDAFSNMSLATLPGTLAVEKATISAPKQEVSKYRTGETVIYRISSGEMTVCTILKVHFDHELDPFYTITLPDGREKQTDDGHLSHVDCSISSQISNMLPVFSQDQLKEILIFMTKIKIEAVGASVEMNTPPLAVDNPTEQLMGGVSSSMNEKHEIVSGTGYPPPPSMPPAPPPTMPPVLPPRMPPAPPPTAPMFVSVPVGEVSAPALMDSLPSHTPMGGIAQMGDLAVPMGAYAMNQYSSNFHDYKGNEIQIQDMTQTQSNVDGVGGNPGSAPKITSGVQQNMLQQGVPPPPVYQPQPVRQLPQQPVQQQYMQSLPHQQVQQQYVQQSPQQQVHQQYVQQPPQQQVQQQYIPQHPQQQMQHQYMQPAPQQQMFPQHSQQPSQQQRQIQYTQQPPQQQMQPQHSEQPPTGPGVPLSPKGNPFDMY